jgi:hypothetical protein
MSGAMLDMSGTMLDMSGVMMDTSDTITVVSTSTTVPNDVSGANPDMSGNITATTNEIIDKSGVKPSVQLPGTIDDISGSHPVASCDISGVTFDISGVSTDVSGAKPSVTKPASTPVEVVTLRLGFCC